MQSAHLAMIDSLMMAYTMETVSVEKVVSCVRQYASLYPDTDVPYDTEDAVASWINKVSHPLLPLHPLLLFSNPVLRDPQMHIFAPCQLRIESKNLNRLWVLEGLGWETLSFAGLTTAGLVYQVRPQSTALGRPHIDLKFSKHVMGLFASTHSWRLSQKIPETFMTFHAMTPCFVFIIIFIITVSVIY